MKKVRFFYDKDKEREWLQEMCDSGYQFTGFFLMVYSFKPCEPGEFYYEIDLLDDYKDYSKYKEFMSDLNVDVICRWYRWVFIRKSSKDGKFDLYSDNESLISHYEEIVKFFKMAFIFELIITIFELTLTLIHYTMISLVSTIVIGMITFLIYRIIKRTNQKIESLKVEVNESF